MAKWSNNKTDQNSGQAPIAYTFSSPVPYELVSVRVHLSAAGGTAENFTIDVDSDAGTKYNVRMFTHDMEEVQDLFWSPDKDISCESGDRLVFTYANTNTRNFGLEIVYRQAI